MSDKITDEKLAEELTAVWQETGGDFRSAFLSVARRAKELLGDKPMATRDGVEAWLMKDGPDTWVRVSNREGQDIVIECVLAALTHFAPPSQRMMIDHILDEIKKERDNQDHQWGGPSHDDTHSRRDWASFIAKQMFDDYNGPNRQAFVKAAALCVAALQSIDRLATRPALDEEGK